MLNMAEVRERINRFVPHDEAKPCGACGAAHGERHQEGCDWERCPHCGEQTIVCGNCFDAIAGEVLGDLLERDMVLVPRSDWIKARALAAENERGER